MEEQSSLLKKNFTELFTMANIAEQGRKQHSTIKGLFTIIRLSKIK